jgi:hypothetical protein
MSIAISGLGWVTPFGTELGEVFEKLRAGAVADTEWVAIPNSVRSRPVRRVPLKSVEHLGRIARLRRSSPVSYFAVAAGLAALADAGIQVGPEMAGRLAVVFAATDGGVQYTRRFYDQILSQGAQAASPMLFPETVYNAPASHLAAQLGINGPSYTLVGDSAAALGALDFAGQLLETDTADLCLVVAAEESDWILAEAYTDWRVSRIPMSEGAAAVVLGRQGRFALKTHPGALFHRRAEVGSAIQRVFDAVASGLEPKCEPTLVVSGANGGFADRTEARVAAGRWPAARLWTPRFQMGDAQGASALMQVVLAALAVERREAASALVSAPGVNQSAGAALVSMSSPII